MVTEVAGYHTYQLSFPDVLLMHPINFPVLLKQRQYHPEEEPPLFQPAGWHPLKNGKEANVICNVISW